MVAIFVALMFIVLILVDLVVQRVEARRGEAALRLGGAGVAARTAAWRSGRGERWALPEGVYLAGGHSWLRPQAHGELALGADALVGYALGRVGSVILPRVGAWLKKGDPLFHLALEGGVLTVSAPVSGEVVAVNDRLKERPGLVAEEPYGNGWVCALAPACLEKESRGMLVGSQAAAWLDREFHRYREFLSAQAAHDLALGATSQDGGLPAPGCLAHFDPGVWSAFQQQFLRA